MHLQSQQTGLRLELFLARLDLAPSISSLTQQNDLARPNRWSIPMVMAQSHFLLFCDTSIGQSLAREGTASVVTRGSGRWLFVLEQIDGPERLEVADSERGVSAERLALLCVVRGLEALEQPSQVTLITTSRYVMRGLRYGLSSWRETGYMWERFGTRLPIRNADLWQRIDVAMQFHGISCRLIQSSLAAPLDSAADASWEASSENADAHPTDYLETTPPKMPGIALGQAKNLPPAGRSPQTRRKRISPGKALVEAASTWWSETSAPSPSLYGT
ncbi:MAG: hypothetical protein KDB22_16355 [Planctomycetales bacterium]|nr:hypothetical protein [Planctomycetales bacterium]